MDKDEVLALFDRQMRREARSDSPGSRVERDGDVVRQVGADGGWNGVLWSDLDDAGAAAAIAAQVAHFTARGGEFEWKLYSHDRPADLGRRLTAAGFAPDPPETLMVARIDELSAEAAPPEGVRLLRVTDPAGVELLADVHDQAFGSGGARIRRSLLAQLAGAPESVVAVVAMAGDRPVSAARMELPPGASFAGLWGGGTAADWRGRGVYRALIVYRAAIAAEHGYDYLQVDASDQSRPILQRLGFTALGTTTPYRYRP
ncbi:GNAT family N-acetyltransferase [Kitasatospora mediocidica]|uniref:GNAT family N-acetyltransferase n=1 Tax=Kitasatospora mediocidica TaxID=58352 RepID=UPI00055E4541|nr:N-acetyltransferase [Kitasatospora mediocidica]